MQEELDLALKGHAAPAEAKPQSPPVPAQSAPVNDDSATALKQLESRYENLVRILLDRNIIEHKDLDELM